MTGRMSSADPLIEFAGCSVLEADPNRAVVSQSPSPELTNHIGARHAGALFTVGYAASRALVEAAVEARDGDLEAQMSKGEVVYEKVVMADTVAATAEPAADDWPQTLAQVSSSEPARLQTTVTLRNESDVTVMVMSVGWEVTRTDEAP
jgi:acyl-coenzyme A thioesterase PaaI-like protein